MYKPQPIDTSDIVLTDELYEVIELLCKNIHDNWANQKIKDGYIYGEITDIKNKTHSSLIEYELLSKSEKKYDRLTIEESLKVLIKLGFKISK